jgi:hypothetical protein
MKILNMLLIPAISIACPISAKDKLSGGKCVDVGSYQKYTKLLGNFF